MDSHGRGNITLFIIAVSCAAALGVLVVVFGTSADVATGRVNLPPEGKPYVMVWRDQAIPEAHIALRRGGDYFSPGPGGALLEDSPPSYWEDIR